MWIIDIISQLYALSRNINGDFLIFCFYKKDMNNSLLFQTKILWYFILQESSLWKIMQKIQYFVCASVNNCQYNFILLKSAHYLEVSFVTFLFVSDFLSSFYSSYLLKQLSGEIIFLPGTKAVMQHGTDDKKNIKISAKINDSSKSLTTSFLVMPSWIIFKQQIKCFIVNSNSFGGTFQFQNYVLRNLWIYD